MQGLGYMPSIALCSPARRTRETWTHISDALDGDTVEDLRPELYLAEPNTLLDAVRAIEDTHSDAIVISHNPGILALALGLAGDDIRADNPFGEYPAAALAVFDFGVASWSGVTPGSGALIEFTHPDKLNSAA